MGFFGLFPSDKPWSTPEWAFIGGVAAFVVLVIIGIVVAVVIVKRRRREYHEGKAGPPTGPSITGPLIRQSPPPSPTGSTGSEGSQLSPQTPPTPQTVSSASSASDSPYQIIPVFSESPYDIIKTQQGRPSSVYEYTNIPTQEDIQRQQKGTQQQQKPPESIYDIIPSGLIRPEPVKGYEQYPQRSPAQYGSVPKPIPVNPYGSIPQLPQSPQRYGVIPQGYGAIPQ